MIFDVNWRYSFCRVKDEHSGEQIHEKRVLIEVVALVFFQSVGNILQHLILLGQDFLLFSSLYAENSLAHDRFAADRRNSAFERHPNWKASDYLK